MSKVKNKTQTEDSACVKRQMLSQYGIIVTFELASHSSCIKRREGVERKLHCERHTIGHTFKTLIMDKSGVRVLWSAITPDRMSVEVET